MPAWPARRRRRARSARRRLGGSRSWPTTRARLPQRSRRRCSSVRSSSALLCRRSCRRVPPPSRTHSRCAATRSWKGHPRLMPSSMSDAARLMLPQPALMTLAEQSASLARERTACAEELARARAMGAPARCCTFAMLRAAHNLARAVIRPRGRKANRRSILLSRRAKGPRRHPPGRACCAAQTRSRTCSWCATARSSAGRSPRSERPSRPRASRGAAASRPRCALQPAALAAAAPLPAPIPRPRRGTRDRREAWHHNASTQTRTDTTSECDARVVPHARLSSSSTGQGRRAARARPEGRGGRSQLSLRARVRAQVDAEQWRRAHAARGAPASLHEVMREMVGEGGRAGSKPGFSGLSTPSKTRSQPRSQPQRPPCGVILRACAH